MNAAIPVIGVIWMVFLVGLWLDERLVRIAKALEKIAEQGQ